MKSYAFIAILLLIVACAPAENTQESATIRVGLMVPLTGPIPNIGEGALAASELAVEEINAAGGINGQMIELVIEDTKCDAKEATTIGNKLLQVNKLPIISGPGCSGATLAVAPIANQVESALISYGSTAPGVSEAGAYVFRVVPSDSFAGKYAAQQAYDMGYKNAVILSCQGDYCDGLRQSFTQTFNEYEDAKVIGNERFETGARDMRAQLVKARELNPDVIYLPAYADEIIVVLRQLAELDWNIPVLSGDAADDPKITSELGEQADIMTYFMPSSSTNEEFRLKMEQKTGIPDLVFGSIQAYDAIYVIAEALKTGARSGVEIRQSLMTMPEYQGVSGKISFDENGDLTNAVYETKKIVNGVAIVIE